MLPAGDPVGLANRTEERKDSVGRSWIGLCELVGDANAFECGHDFLHVLRKRKTRELAGSRFVLQVVLKRDRQKEKATNIPVDSLYLCRQRPTLPRTFARSTIGPAGLNFRVRDGNGWIPRGKITDNLIAPSARIFSLLALSRQFEPERFELRAKAKS